MESMNRSPPSSREKALMAFVSPSSPISFFPSTAIYCSASPNHSLISFYQRTIQNPKNQCLVQAALTDTSSQQGQQRLQNPTTATTTATDSTTIPKQQNDIADVVIIGGGPAGLSLAAELGERLLKVVIIDANIYKAWPNHYGVWADEFETIGLGHCFTEYYSRTCVFVGDDNEDDKGKIVLDRPYLRVDRVLLKKLLVEKCKKYNVKFVKAFVDCVRHVNSQQSYVEYRHVSRGGDGHAKGAEGSGLEKDVMGVYTRLAVDATGHSLNFVTSVRRDKEPPAFQAAYGIEAEVLWHPFAIDEMVLMDFRDEHMQHGKDNVQASSFRPTFLYVFPTSKTRVFLEETSVIAPQPVSFDELKRRLYLRMDQLGIKVVTVLEEEKSLIPLGGSVPDLKQRIIGFGGAACLVHPATGYMVARTMRRAKDVSDAIVERIRDKGLVSINERRVTSGLGMDEVAGGIWDNIWSLSERRQRDFLTFGADLLAALSMEESRLFFRAFFKLPKDLWTGFLSFELDRPEQRIEFALRFFFVADWKIRIQLLVAIFEIGRWKLMRSFLPLPLSGND